MSHKEPKIIVTENGDRVEIQFTPLPPERRQAYREAMRWITQLILEILDDFPICVECSHELHVTTDGMHECRNETCSQFGIPISPHP